MININLTKTPKKIAQELIELLQPYKPASSKHLLDVGFKMSVRSAVITVEFALMTTPECYHLLPDRRNNSIRLENPDYAKLQEVLTILKDEL